jgi:hypothetical protein
MYASLKDLNQSKEVFLFFINLFIKNIKKKNYLFW